MKTEERTLNPENTITLDCPEVKIWRDFLSVLFPDTNNEFIEIRAFGAEKSTKELFFKTSEEVLSDWANIRALALTRNVYVGVCPRRNMKGGKDDVSRIHCLWADLDAKAFNNGKSEALERLKRFSLPPTMIIDSGNGYHAYWRLKKAEDITGKADIQRLEAYLKGISVNLPSDPTVGEVARILRLPGTTNHKDPNNKLPVSLVECNPDRQYNLSSFDTCIVVPQPKKSVNPPGWLSESLREMCDGNRNSTFAKVTGSLHRNRYTPADIFALLSPLAAEYSFPQDELRRVVESISKYPQANSLPSSLKSLDTSVADSAPMKAMSLNELFAAGGSKIDWRIKDVLPLQGVGILGGPSGIGKTWMLLDLAIECAVGGKWIGHLETTKGRVLYIDEESSHMLLRHHLTRLLTAKNQTNASLDLFFAVEQGLRLTNSNSVEKLGKLLDEKKPDLVIVDTLIRVHDAEENSASAMSQVFEVIRHLRQRHGCAFLFADHQRKPGATMTSPEFMLRGSSDKVAAVDTLLSVIKKDDDRIVDHSKSRYGKHIQAFVFRIADISDEATTLSYLGESDLVKKMEKQGRVREMVSALLNEGEKSRKHIVEHFKAEGTPQAVVDETLKDMQAEGMVQRSDRKTQEGRGGLQAFYNLKKEGSV